MSRYYCRASTIPQVYVQGYSHSCHFRTQHTSNCDTSHLNAHNTYNAQFSKTILGSHHIEDSSLHQTMWKYQLHLNYSTMILMQNFGCIGELYVGAMERACMYMFYHINTPWSTMQVSSSLFNDTSYKFPASH